MAAAGGDIPATVQRLRSSSAAQQVAATKELRRLAATGPEGVAAVVAAGAVPALVRLLRSSREPVQAVACRALADLMFFHANNEAAGAAAGAIPPLLHLLLTSGSRDVVVHAISALCSPWRGAAPATQPPWPPPPAPLACCT